MQATFRNSVLEMLKRGKHMQTADILQINTEASIWLLSASDKISFKKNKIGKVTSLDNFV